MQGSGQLSGTVRKTGMSQHVLTVVALLFVIEMTSKGIPTCSVVFKAWISTQSRKSEVHERGDRTKVLRETPEMHYAQLCQIHRHSCHGCENR